MSKTREIEVWVDPGVDFNRKGSMFGQSAEIDGEPHEDWLPAKLIISEPEKKVIITESEFDEAVRLLPMSSGERELVSDALKERLFGKGGERDS